MFSCKLPAKQEALRIFKINMSTMKKSTIITAFLTIVFSSANTIAQPSCSSLNITHKADIVSNCSQMMMTMIHDQNDHPYLYVANKEAGLKVYDISVITAPSLVATVATTLFDMLDVMKQFDSVVGEEIQIRIGIHCGEVVAGVIGKKKFAYDLWGDAVNTASRMESHGEAGKIHVSEEFVTALTLNRPSDTFSQWEKEGMRAIPRGEKEIKGKGMMRTYFLEKA